MAKLVELSVVKRRLKAIEKSYGDLNLHVYASLEKFVRESGGMDVFTREARRWINDKYAELLEQK